MKTDDPYDIMHMYALLYCCKNFAVFEGQDEARQSSYSRLCIREGFRRLSVWS